MSHSMHVWCIYSITGTHPGLHLLLMRYVCPSTLQKKFYFLRDRSLPDSFVRQELIACSVIDSQGAVWWLDSEHC
jgi:hypothetical protein